MSLRNKILISGIILFGIMLTEGCNTYWDEHYNTLDNTSEKEKIISEMEKIPEISMFTEAVKQVDSLSELLQQNRLFTVFAPVNAAFETIDPAILNNDHLLNRMLMYHFIDGKFKYKDLSANDFITYGNKYLNISVEGTASTPVIDNNSSIINPDYLALNGMIHVVDLPLLPLNNLYEYFVYNARVHDFDVAIQSYTNKEFNLEASTPIAKNADGDIVYDSVFIITNPFLYSGMDWIRESFYNTNIRYVDIRDEDLDYTFMAPTNFSGAISEVLNSPVLNNPIATNDFVGPILANLIMNTSYSKDELISEIEMKHALPEVDSSEIQLYFLDLLKNNYAGEIALSNGIVHEVNAFEYDLGWLITDQGNMKEDMDQDEYKELLLSNTTYSDGVDSITVSSNNIQTIFCSSPDFNLYTSKYGEWVNFGIEGDFYPVDYKVLVRGRNNSSGTFRVEIEGQEISEYNFSQAPSGDLDNIFDEIGTVSFNETKSFTNLKFTFIKTHSEFNTNQQFLWIREIKLSPVLK